MTFPARQSFAFLATIAGLFGFAATANAVVNYRMVAASGTQAPGAPAGAKFGPSFEGAYLDSAGHVSFRADLQIGSGGVTATNNSGYWWEGSGPLMPLAREGDQAPGMPVGTLFAGFSDAPKLNAAGQVAFLAEWRVGTGGVNSADDVGIWTGDANGLSLVARSGDAAPGGSLGGAFSTINNPVINAAGRALIRAEVTTPLYVDGLWSNRSGTLAPIAMRGEHAPGTTNGVNFQEFFEDGMAINASGHVAFAAKLTLNDGSYSQNQDNGVWTDSSGSLELIARNGDSAPGAPDGKTFFNLNGPVLSDSGRAVFVAWLAPYLGAPKGIWSKDSGPVTLVALEGNQAPGVPAGAKFGPMAPEVGDVTINPAGHIAFMAGLHGKNGGIDGTNDSGIWSDRSGTLDLIVRKGSHAPGTEPGVNFEQFSNAATINAAGRISFTAALNGTDPAAHDSLGLWAEDQAGNLNLIVRSGQTFHIGPNDDRIVAQFWPSDTFDGEPASFNENTLAFILDFTDGSQAIYTASLLSLPGDYDRNGIVDAGDYNVWRKSLGQTATGLPADGDNNGTIDLADFDIWRTNYGAQAAGSGANVPATIPEPTSLLLLLITTTYVVLHSRRTNRRS